MAGSYVVARAGVNQPRDGRDADDCVRKILPPTYRTMLYADWNGYRLSRLMLGTVQFGLPYGVANRTGQPSYHEVVEMLAEARATGINCLDTASAYGTSEDVLGRALSELKAHEQFFLVTKVRALTAEELAEPTRAEQAIVTSVAKSRERLQLDCLPLVLFHREPDATYLPVLDSLRDRGWLRHVGVSCDHVPQSATAFVSHRLVSAVQLPANLVDRRHQQGGVMIAAAERGVAVFLRSVYLQGLLLMSEDQMPAHLRDIVPVRQQLNSLAQQAGLTLAELAVRYLLGLPGVTCVLTGVETKAQLRDNVSMFERGPLPADLQRAVEDLPVELPELVVTPRLWSAGAGK